MGRRSKVDLYGLVDRVLSLYDEGKTLVEIESILRSEGYDISRESIRKRIKSAKEVASIYKQSLEEAKILLETVKDNPNTDVIEVTNSLLAHKLFEFAKSIEEINFDNPVEFVNAVKQLANAQVRIAKLRLDYQKGFEAAKKEIIEAVSKELEKHPKLRNKLIEVINDISVEIT